MNARQPRLIGHADGGIVESGSCLRTHGTCLAFGCPPALKWDEADVLQAKRDQQDPARNAARLDALLSVPGEAPRLRGHGP